MPKIKIGAGDFSGVDAATTRKDYDGELPPKGLYRCKVTTALHYVAASGNHCIKFALNIAEPSKSPKAKFNGYTIWENLTLAESSAAFVNAKLDALGLSRKAVWVTGFVVDEADAKKKQQKIKSIGGKNPAGIEVMVQAKRENEEGYEEKLVAAAFFPAKAAAAEDDSDDDEGDNDDASDTESDDDGSDDDADSDDGDGDDDDSF